MSFTKKKIIVTFIIIFIVFYEYNCQTIWTESFSNGCASGCLATSYGGWTETATGTNGTGANRWYVSGAECGNAVGTCGSSCGGTDPSLHIGANQNSECTCLICFDPVGDCGAAYDASSAGVCLGFCTGGGVTTNKRIESPVINCTGYSNIMLSFSFIHNGNDGSNDECSVWYFDGTTWNNLGVLPRTVGICSPQGYWTNYTIPLPASANNNPNIKIGFNWKNNANSAGTDPSVAIDDIILYVKPGSCYNSGFAAYTGGGCTANCNLTEFTGFTSMCNGTSVGCASCPSTGPTLSQNFTITPGCTATLTASFQRRCNGVGCAACSNTCNIMSSSSGCCNSGLDANDYLKVGGSIAPVSTTTINLSDGYTSTCGGGAATTAFSTSGNTITATGNNNGGAIIQYVQTGGVLFVEGRANRMDEIITFTVNIQSGCTCSDIVLPVDIFSFFAIPKKGLIELQWITKNEKHLSHYKIEKSTDGISFYPLVVIPSENVIYEKTYIAYDDNPTIGLSYYKLTPVNIGGNDENSIIRDAVYQLDYQPFHYSVQNDELTLTFSDFEIPTSFTITNLSGQVIYQISEINNSNYAVNTSLMSRGVYIGILKNRYQTLVYKIIIM